jgi:cell division protein FtsW (lipid II flippase)
MSEKRMDYLDKVIQYVRYKEAKRFVAEELRFHLEQEMKLLKKSGMNEKDTEEKAIQHMGSAERLGQEMNKLYRPRVDWIMIGLVLLLSLIGILPTLHISEEIYNDNGYLVRKIVYLILGIVLSLSLMMFDYRKLRAMKWWIYGLTTLLLISITVFPNTYRNGEAQFRVSSFSIDSTTVLTALVISWMVYLGSAKAGFWKSLPLFAFSLCALMFIPSTTAVFVFTLTVTVLLWFRFKRNRKHILWGYIGMAIGSAVLISTLVPLVQPYQLERFYAFVNPGDYKNTSGYMYFRNHELLRKGGWFGETGGNVVINEPHTNFAFTTITYHYGWIAGGVLILTGLFIMYRMIRNIKRIHDCFGQLIIICGVTLFSTQFLYNIGMILGVLPHTGMSLPIVSYGLNPTLQTSIVVGLFLSVYRRKNLLTSQEVGTFNMKQ